MKDLILLGGPMGVGKTTVCRSLMARLDGCFWLDGDWCWTMHPFIVNDETKALVVDNIVHTLSGFLRCSRCRTALLSWVLDLPETWELLLRQLPLDGCRVHRVILTARAEVLAARVAADVAAGIREPGAVERSLARLPRYAGLPGLHLDTTGLTPDDVAAQLLDLLTAQETVRTSHIHIKNI